MPEFPRTPGLPKIYFHVSENSGVGYYRTYLPALKLREHKLADTMISDFRWGVGDHVELSLDKLMPVINWADLVVVGRKDMGQFYAQWGAIKELFNIPIIMDTDDNVENVRPTNPGYQGYHPGSEAIVWNKFGMAKVFDGVTVSTSNLVEYYKRYNPKIFELPNSLDVAEWRKHTKKVHDDGFIRIGFMASASHPESAHIIRKPILELLKKHKNVKFLITSMFLPLFEGVERVEAIPWIPLKDWPRDYQNLGLDIGLAPLADNLFNRAKSNLRWMEYSVQGVPSVVSPVEAYKCVRDGVDGFFATEHEEWVEKIEALILDADLRKKVGITAMERINEEYNIDTNIPQWMKVYRGIIRKHEEFFGEKKQFFINTKGLREFGAGRRK